MKKLFIIALLVSATAYAQIGNPGGGGAVDAKSRAIISPTPIVSGNISLQCTVGSNPSIAVSAGPFVTCSPAQLGVNALTEPGSGTSALSTIIDTSGSIEATLKATCTQGAWTLNIQTYAEDGVTTLALVSPVSAIAAATNTDIYLGSESAPSASGGTISTTAIVRFPQRAIAFSFTNSSITAGTCTARLILNY